jgi:hypothetical protein
MTTTNDKPSWEAQNRKRKIALEDELRRMNTALARGKLAWFTTSEEFIGEITGDPITKTTIWYLCKAEILNHALIAIWLRLQPGPEPEHNQDVCFMGNDERWAAMLVQVGEPRNPIFLPRNPV